MIIIKLIIQFGAMFFGYKLYGPAMQMLGKSGLHVLGALFTIAPVLAIVLIITTTITISLLIRAFINIKRYWWLLIIELASITAHVYVVITLIRALKG